MNSNQLLSTTILFAVISAGLMLSPTTADANISISYSSGGHHGSYYKYGSYNSHDKHKHRKHYKHNRRRNYKHSYASRKPYYNHYNKYPYGRNHRPHKIYKLPRYADFVWVGGNRYYHFDGVYYQPSSCGTFYTYVDSPYKKVESTQTRYIYEEDIYERNDESEFVVHLKDRKGDLVKVKIKKSVHGYIGPQGEYYPEFPKVAQLKAMYTK